MTKAEQFIKDCTSFCSNGLSTLDSMTLGYDYNPWLTPEQALGAVEVAREELIDKACRWLKDNTFKGDWPSAKVFVEYFRKAMEETV